MTLAKEPNEKLAAVRDAYLLSVILAIRCVYEKANKVRESFVLVHCTILGLSGFYAGAKDTGGDTYRQFVADFFPNGYEPDKLWKDLRNNLVHAYTITRSYALAHKHHEMHLAQLKGAKSSRTGIPSDFIVLNFEDYLDDFEKAASIYFGKAEHDPDLLLKLYAGMKGWRMTPILILGMIIFVVVAFVPLRREKDS
jgi:hypothetical protein